MQHCVHCYVSGKVQGVWYRGSAQKMAQELNLTGSARNLDDGRVEVLACGERRAIESFKQWLWQGPQLAQVNDVVCEEINLQVLPQHFTTE